MTLQEYSKTVKKLIDDMKLSAYLTRNTTKKWIESCWNTNRAPSYCAAMIRKEAAG